MSVIPPSQTIGTSSTTSPDLASTMMYNPMAFMSKLPFPGAKSRQYFTCVYTALGQKICYGASDQNTLECDALKCKVVYRTPDQSFLTKSFPEGVFLNVEPATAKMRLYLLGIFDRKDLPSMQKMLPDAQVKAVPSVTSTFGLPEPPNKCGWLPWVDGCRPYAESAEWSLGWRWKSPFLQWKRSPMPLD